MFLDGWALVCLKLVFADVNKQMGIIKNHCLLNRDLDTLVVTSQEPLSTSCGHQILLGKSRQVPSSLIKEGKPKIKEGLHAAPGATPLPTPMPCRVKPWRMQPSQSCSAHNWQV